MPVLFYGLENIKLTVKNIKTIQKAGNNLLRYIFFIPKRCRTSVLRLAINIKKTSDKLKYHQIEFFERLLKNQFTKSLITEMLRERGNIDYIDRTLSILNEITYGDSFEIIDKCQYFKYSVDLEFETSKKNNMLLTQVLKIFNRNKDHSEQLFKALRYDNYTYPYQNR